MPCPDIVVVGASAGGLEAVQRLVRSLPEDFPAAVFIVIHRGPEGPTILPMLLQTWSRLPIRVASSPEAIRGGHIYLAPLDCHLLIQDSQVHSSHGPRQHGFRPAVDAEGAGSRSRHIRELIEAMNGREDKAATAADGSRARGPRDAANHRAVKAGRSRRRGARQRSA